MASLISDSEKTSLNEVMDDQHDTFARAVTVIKDPIKTVPTPSSSFNSIYGNAGATTPIVIRPRIYSSSKDTIWIKFRRRLFQQLPVSKSIKNRYS